MDSVDKKIDSFSEIVDKFKDAITPKNESQNERVDPPVSALADIASVCHAHTVKIGLAFKPPVSESAAISCLDENIKLVPAFAAAYMGMTDAKDSRLMRLECRIRLIHLYSEQQALASELKRIVQSEKENSGRERKEKEDKLSETSLACLNKVLEQCNKLQELKTLGPGGVAGQKLDLYQMLIKDASSELQSWIHNPDGNSMGFSDDEDDDNDDADANDQKDGGERPNELLQLGKKWHDKLIKLEYLVKAIRNRRVKLLDVRKLDQVVSQVDKLSGSIDDLVSTIQFESELPESIPDQINEDASNLLDLAHVEVEQPDQYVKWVTLFKDNFFK